VLILRPMRQNEYPAYCDYFIDDYSTEIAENYGHTMDVANQLAHKDLHRCFPDGLETNEHDLLCLEAKIQGKDIVVGYLWHSINIEDQSTFIYDFYVSDSFRGKGFGKYAIAELEKQLQSVGIKQIKLRVAYHNKRALALYKDVGFAVTGYNMSKTLPIME